MNRLAQTKTYKIVTWNVNGIRASLRKGFLDWFAAADADVVCVQEIKALEEQLPAELKEINGYTSYFFSAKRKGYSGVATYTRIKAAETLFGIDNEHYDHEGRLILSDFGKFVLANVYFPNGGRGPERVKYKLDFYNELFFLLQKKYSGRKGVIVTGDFNTAHKEIDLARPKENKKTSGFLPEERAWIDNIINLGYADIYRKFHHEPGRYTYWDVFTRARERNVGWRIDYFMVSEDIAGNVISCEINDGVQGSDHCPVTLEIKI